MMKRLRLTGLVVLAMLLSAAAFWPGTADGRGGRGGGGGGRGGGGGFSGGGGRGFSGGGGVRVGSSPSFSRPASRPSSGVSRPSGGSRPSALPSRPGGAGARPGTLPSGLQLGGRPGVGTGQRPGVGNRPAQFPSTRPGISQRPGIAQLPAAGIGAGIGAAAGSRLPGAGNRPAQLPGLERGSRWDQIQGNRQDFVSDRRQDLQSRLENRQDFRNQWQENRQDFLNDRREDWQNQLDDRYPWHDGWHHGYWNGNFGNYWEHMWSEHPVWSAFSVTGWALNAASYMFGTGGYSDPYYDSGSSSGMAYDYSEPIVMYSEPVQEAALQVAADGSALPPGVTQDALSQFEQARSAFGQGQYKQALDLANQALKSMPSDATLHEFTALCYFALGQYRQAAAVLNAVLAVGPGWDWTTLVSLYPDVDVYTAQLRKLEEYIRANPNAPDARFVLAYHYLTTNHPEAAAGQLEYVVKSVPNDAIAKQLYDMLTYKASGEPKLPVESLAPAGPAVTAEELAGTWKAKGPSNSAFEMTLTKEGAFTWKYAKGKKERVVKGAYAVDRNTLAMEPASGGVMLADLIPQNANAVDFKMIGSPATEAPLKFTR